MFLLFALLRVFIACSIATSYVPDEYWQSIEVAYFEVYGKGDLTWEWKTGLRSCLHAQIYSLLFYVIRGLGIDTPTVMFLSPRVLQGLFCALLDVAVIKLTSELARLECRDAEHIHSIKKVKVAKTLALKLLLFTWSHPFHGCRTLVNSIEALLTTWAAIFCTKISFNVRQHTIKSAMYIQKDSAFLHFIVTVGIATALRVTSILYWIPVICLCTLSSKARAIRTFVIGLVCLAVLTVLDSLFYGELTCTPLQFLLFNVFQGQSAIFGTHPFTWYLTHGLFILLGPLYPILLQSVVVGLSEGQRLQSKKAILSLSVLWTILAYSLLPHKEVRFLYPILPIAISLCSISLMECGEKGKPWIPKCIHRGALPLYVILNLGLFVTLGYLHQRGNLAAFTYLRGLPETMRGAQNGKERLSLDIWMGCHQTPGYSHLHGKIHTLNTIQCPLYLSENGKEKPPTPHAIFMKYPREFLLWNYANISSNDEHIQQQLQLVRLRENRTATFPDFVLLYDDLSMKMMDFLHDNKYVEVGRWFHTFFPFEESTGHYSVLYRKKLNKETLERSATNRILNLTL